MFFNVSNVFLNIFLNTFFFYQICFLIFKLFIFKKKQYIVFHLEKNVKTKKKIIFNKKKTF